MARDLDPKINILKCAIPYFENNNHAIAEKAEKSFLTAVWTMVISDKNNRHIFS